MLTVKNKTYLKMHQNFNYIKTRVPLKEIKNLTEMSPVLED